MRQQGTLVSVDAGFDIALAKQHEICMALCEHFVGKDDDVGFSLFCELLDTQHMLSVLICDASSKVKVLK
jgi:hypothetical protein